MNKKEQLSIKDNLFLFIKLETSGFPVTNIGSISKYYPYTQLDKYDDARIVKISWGIYDFKQNKKQFKSFIIKPDDYLIDNSNIHGITQETADSVGTTVSNALDVLSVDLNNVRFIVGHNLEFSTNIMYSEFYRSNSNKKEQVIDRIKHLEHICTADMSTNIVKIAVPHSKSYKTPKFSELYNFCFKDGYNEIENKKHDVYIENLMRCFFHLAKNAKTKAK